MFIECKEIFILRMRVQINIYARKISESLLLCFEYEKGILDLEFEHIHG